MLPLWPSYEEQIPAEGVLGVVSFDASVAIDAKPEPRLTVALPPLEGGRTPHEVWRSATPVFIGREGGVRYAHNGSVLFGALVIDGTDAESAGREAYANVLSVLRVAGYPHLLRVWNHVNAINEGTGDLETYKRFCAGRHEALVASGMAKEQFCAASAVGMRGGVLAMHFIAGKDAGIQIENPRQLSAYDYPRQYGRRSPSFSRATVARWGGDAILLVSGTASVIGHETVHRGDVVAQTEETLRNLDLVVKASSDAARRELRLDMARTAKVYVRRPEDAAGIRAAFAAATPAAQLLVVQSDICRSDLLLEAEVIVW